MDSTTRGRLQDEWYCRPAGGSPFERFVRDERVAMIAIGWSRQPRRPPRRPTSDPSATALSEIVVTGSRIRSTELYRAHADPGPGPGRPGAQRRAERLHHHRSAALLAGLDRRDDGHLQHLERPAGPELVLAAGPGHHPDPDPAGRPAGGSGQHHRRSRHQPVPATPGPARRRRDRRRVRVLRLGRGRRRGQLHHRQALRPASRPMSRRGHDLRRQRAVPAAGRGRQELPERSPARPGQRRIRRGRRRSGRRVRRGRAGQPRLVHHGDPGQSRRHQRRLAAVPLSRARPSLSVHQVRPDQRRPAAGHRLRQERQSVPVPVRLQRRAVQGRQRRGQQLLLERRLLRRRRPVGQRRHRHVAAVRNHADEQLRPRRLRHRRQQRDLRHLSTSRVSNPPTSPIRAGRRRA
jgi:hypothetical protein